MLAFDTLFSCQGAREFLRVATTHHVEVSKYTTVRRQSDINLRSLVPRRRRPARPIGGPAFLHSARLSASHLSARLRGPSYAAQWVPGRRAAGHRVSG